MDLQKRSLQVGAAAIACALILRFGGGVLDKAIGFFSRPEVVQTILFLETGRKLLPVETTVPIQPTETVPTEPTYAPAVFSVSDSAAVEVNSSCGYEADVQTFLQQPLVWDLTQKEPSVLIFHTHATESYTPTGEYEESVPYRTWDTGHNVVSIGAELSQQLENAGVGVIHDTMLHDADSYNGSYSHARTAIEQYLQDHPSIALVLDIHRDSVEDDEGKQVRTVVQTPDGEAAPLMLVVGTDAGGWEHAGWPDNMALAVKLHAQLEKRCPGICRPISFRSQRFNQDLSPGALLIEVGSAGNTRQQALLSAQILAQAIADLAHGAVMD